MTPRAIVLVAVVASMVALSMASLAASRDTRPAGARSAGTLRLGYFANVTHAPALVGLEGGLFEKALGSKAELETPIFNAGPAAVEAILTGSVDATYIGPNPAVTAFLQSDGAIQVISGAASGGAFLVVQPEIKSAKDLKGKSVATPQLGNTQDVALRSWLKKKGLKTDTAGGGDVSIRPQDNALTLQAFQQNEIQGAWVPEPWATRLVAEGGGKILLDEATLWPGGKYATTNLIVSKKYLKDHPDIVQALLVGHVEAVAFIEQKPAEAQELVGERIEQDTGKALAADLIAASFESITFTNDPIASSVVVSAKHAASLDLPGAVPLSKADVKKLYNLKPLNKVLKAKGQSTVSASAT